MGRPLDAPGKLRNCFPRSVIVDQLFSAVGDFPGPELAATSFLSCGSRVSASAPI